MPSPDETFHVFDGSRFATARERRLWNLWLATVALLIVGSLVAWLLIVRSPVQPATARAADAPPARVTPTYTPASPRQFRYTLPTPPTAGQGIVWVNTRSKVYHYPGYRWYGTTISGKYVGEMDALAEGDRAARNERRPVTFYATPRP